MVKRADKEYGVWACLRDWSPEEQIACGARNRELACFYLDEKKSQFDFKGLNHTTHLVTPAAYERGLLVEDHMLRGHTLDTLPDQAHVGLPFATILSEGRTDSEKQRDNWVREIQAAIQGHALEDEVPWNICVHENAASDASGDCACNAGYTGPSGGTCTACEAGKYKNATGPAACTACPASSVSPAGLCGLFS
jgi:hypothetical protein